MAIEKITGGGAADFEDTVSAALIACFETKIVKNRGAPPTDRLTDDRLRRMRSAGPYIASSSRVLITPEMASTESAFFDIGNDALPRSGCFSWRPLVSHSLGEYSGYLLSLHVRQATSLGKNWHRRGGGVLYEALILAAENEGIEGERFFFTVSKGGEVIACDVRYPAVRGYSSGSPSKFLRHDPAHLRQREIWASVAMQMIADRRFCWVITGEEKSARAHLGCMQEEVKSLLYARSLPMTNTGRKRPILHLVEAHKRRIKNGVDVDVSAFLRGQQVVEIGGTLFRVSPPESMRKEVSRSSQNRFFSHAPA